MKLNRKRRALRVGKQTDQLLSNPASPQLFEQSQNQPITSQLKDTAHRTKALMNLIHYANIMQMFKKSINRFKGTNSPVAYKPIYNFSEKWEDTSKTKIEKNENIYLAAGGIYFIISMLVMLHKIPMIWFLSVNKIYRLPESQQWFITGLIFAFIDLLLRMYLVYRQQFRNIDQQQSCKKQIILKTIWLFLGDVVTIICYLIQLANLNSKGSIDQILFDYSVVFIQSKRFLQIYNALVIMLISHKYKNTVNLFGFMGKLFVSLHICAIIVYAVTFVSPGQNWLLEIGKHNSNEITKYVYSIYFIGTTMLTVGYGDILPTNNVEIILILFIQVLGTVLGGYIISEVGHILTAMRQDRDDFEQDVQNADTICNNYQLRPQLKHRVRNYIINNRLANQQLNVKEQNNILMKLNEQLRSQVNNVNHLNIIKTSLFFICHWSKKIQTDLSKKLQKMVFSPNQRISKMHKLYIITNGKIDVYTERKLGQKIFCKKKLKTIYRDPKKQVFSNVYGSTSLITGKPCRLAAVSKDFAICYAVNYSDFMQVLKDEEKDFQFYHQTKVKLEQQEFPQKFQVSNLINNRQHYCPSHYWIVKKHKKNTQVKQQRKQCMRSNRKTQRTFLQQVQIPDSDSDLESIQDRLMSQYQISQSNAGVKEKEKEKGKKSAKGLGCIKIGSNRSCLTFRSYRRRYLCKVDEEKAKSQEMQQIISNHLVDTSQFESGKQYSKYFKQGNCSSVLKKISKNEFKNLKEVDSKKMQLDWIDLLIFAQKIHNQDQK